MRMLEIKDTTGRIVRRSQNLACISRHCNAVPIVNGRKFWRKRGAPSIIIIDPVPVCGAEFQIAWGNGDTLKHIFAGASICVEWMTSKRFLQGAEISIDSKIWDTWLNDYARETIAKKFAIDRVAKGKRVFLTPKL
jgi:hypothetical protein